MNTDSNSIEIQVKTAYIQEQSSPEKNQYVYSYTITLTNNGSENAQLMDRHWIITDGQDNIQEVKGAGVVGQQPVIAPGESYTYTSGTVMPTKTGMMTGTYSMRTPDGDTFTAEIPAFALLQPEAVH